MDRSFPEWNPDAKLTQICFAAIPFFLSLEKAFRACLSAWTYLENRPSEGSPLPPLFPSLWICSDEPAPVSPVRSS